MAAAVVPHPLPLSSSRRLRRSPRAGTAPGRLRSCPASARYCCRCCSAPRRRQPWRRPASQARAHATRYRGTSTRLGCLRARRGEPIVAWQRAASASRHAASAHGVCRPMRWKVTRRSVPCKRSASSWASDAVESAENPSVVTTTSDAVTREQQQQQQQQQRRPKWRRRRRRRRSRAVRWLAAVAGWRRLRWPRAARADGRGEFHGAAAPPLTRRAVRRTRATESHPASTAATAGGTRVGGVSACAHTPSRATACVR